MPYIPQGTRKWLDQYIPHFSEVPNDFDGCINYIITRIINDAYGYGSYSRMNRGLGVLEAVKQEFYRRRVAPFEDEKKKINGDVYKNL